MKILVINAGRNVNVKSTIDTLKATIGADNTDVIEYGWEAQQVRHANTSDRENVTELNQILSKAPLRAQNYDLLLVSGGHGDAQLNIPGNKRFYKKDDESKFFKTQFNSLTPEGTKDLIAWFNTQGTTFNNILLGTCFSANFQNEFKELLADDSGTILGFTTIAPSNLGNLAVNIAKGETPDMGGLLTSGLATVMNELIDKRNSGGTWDDIEGEFIPAQFTILESELMDDFEPVSKQIEAAGKLSNLINSIEIEYPHNIGYAIERLEGQLANIASLGMTKDEEIKAQQAINTSILVLSEILSSFTNTPAISGKFKNELEKQDGSQVEAVIKHFSNSSDAEVENARSKLKSQLLVYNSSTEIKNLKDALQDVGKKMELNKEAQMLGFMQNNYQKIVRSGDLNLLSGVESTICVYQNNNVYVRSSSPEILPRVIMAASDLSEIPEQLSLIKLEMAAMEKQGMTINEVDTLTLPIQYANLIALSQTPENSSENDESIFDIPQIPTDKLAKPSGDVKKSYVENFGFYAPKKIKEVTVDPVVQPGGISVPTKGN